MRRARAASAPRVQRVGAIEIDTAAREVRIGGAPVELSATEFALLRHLASDPRRASP